MPRKARSAPGGLVYHVLNRAAGRRTLFSTEKDFLAFERVMREAHDRVPLRVLAYCVLPNHWHFVVWPRDDGEVSAYFRWLANTHAMRYRVAHKSIGHGPLYQGRFKSFPVQRDDHLLTVLRYVERNALSAGLVGRAEDWRRGSLWAGGNESEKETEGEAGKSENASKRLPLANWPIARPAGWVDTVNAPLAAKERERLDASLKRGRPFGTDRWTEQTAKRMDLGHTIRREGRPAIKRVVRE